MNTTTFFWIIKVKKKKISKSDFHLTFGLTLIKVMHRRPLLNRPAFVVLKFVAVHRRFDTEAEQVAVKAFYHIMFLCIPGNRYSGKLLVIALYDALSTGIANKLSLFHNVHKQKGLWSSISIKLEQHNSELCLRFSFLISCNSLIDWLWV